LVLYKQILGHFFFIISLVQYGVCFVIIWKLYLSTQEKRFEMSRLNWMHKGLFRMFIILFFFFCLFPFVPQSPFFSSSAKKKWQFTYTVSFHVTPFRRWRCPLCNCITATLLTCICLTAGVNLLTPSTVRFVTSSQRGLTCVGAECGKEGGGMDHTSVAALTNQLCSDRGIVRVL